jgi:hypothetical protein
VRLIWNIARCGLLAAAAGAIISGCSGGSQSQLMPAAPQTGIDSAPGMVYKFKTINNDSDPTFNQLLGINDSGKIAGYYGSGTASSPNKGYTVVSPYGQANFTSENYPGSVQTQVTCIDNRANTAGFWVDGSGVNRGFIEWKGVFTSYVNPKTGKGTVNQILGLNNAGVAVGFYTDSTGVNHGYTLNQSTGKFAPVQPPGATNVTASGINDRGDIVGYYTSGSETIGFLKKNGKFSTFTYPNSSVTMPSGVNIDDDIVGGYTGASSSMHGFLATNVLVKANFKTIDDPKGKGTTFINGINDNGDMVGFYGPSSDTNGMLITKK